MTTATEAGAVQGEVLRIPLGKLKEAAYNPRQHFNDKELADLVESVKAKGVINPILARPVNGHFEIIAGARRFRASKAAGLKDAPVLVRALNDQEALEVAVIDNLQRVDVHPLDEAGGYKALLDQPGYDVAGIAAKVGKSASYVYQRLKLAELIEPAKKAFWKDEIAAGHAVQIARLRAEDQKDVIEVLGRQSFTTRELADFIERRYHLDLHAAPFRKDDARLVPEAGPCTTCPRRTGTTPELFPDVKKKDTCLDKACYDAKWQAWKQLKLAEVGARAEQAVLVSDKDSWEIDKNDPRYKDVLPAGGWHSAGKKCGAVFVGIAADGKRIGQEFAVCTAKDCGKTSPADAQEARWEREREKRQKREAVERKKAERENQVVSRILAAMASRVESFTREDLLLIASGFFEDVWYDRRKRILDRHGWDGKKKGLRRISSIESCLEGLTDGQLMAFILEIALSRTGLAKTEEAAKRHGVDVVEVREAFKAEESALIKWTAGARGDYVGKVKGTSRTVIIKPCKIGKKAAFQYDTKPFIQGSSGYDSIEAAKAGAEKAAATW